MKANIKRRIFAAFSQRLLTNPVPYRIQRHHQQLDQLQVRLNLGVNRYLDYRRNKLAHLYGKMDSLSPLKVLSRGYSIAEDIHGKAISQSGRAN